MPLHAVITGDIVNSTLLTPKAEKKLRLGLQKILAPYKHEFYRGDSFQAYIKQPENALRISLLCRTATMGAGNKENTPPCDIRISIGLGALSGPVRKLATARGEAFLLSGRAFDQLSQTNRRLFISARGPKSIGYGFDLVATYLDAVLREITSKQASVIHQLLSGKNQQEIARHLKKSKSTISQMVSSAKWTEIEWLLTMYDKLLKEIK